MYHLISGITVLFHQPYINHSTDDATLISHLLTTFTLHHSFTISFQAQNSPCPQIFSTIIC